MPKVVRVLVLVSLLASAGLAVAGEARPLIIYTAFFDVRSSTLSSDDLVVLDRIASLLGSDSSYEIRVEAYTDPVDEDADDEELAKARGKAVRDHLTRKGIDKDRIDVKARGDQDRFGRDDSATDRALRRRAEIRVRQEDRARRAIDTGLEKDADTALQTSVFFDFDKAEIRPEFRVMLNRLGEMLAGNSGYRARIFGHTDGVGAADYNVALANRRCDAVIAELEKRGVSHANVERQSLGDRETIGSQSVTATTSRALSRSVEIRVLKTASEDREKRKDTKDEK